MADDAALYSADDQLRIISLDITSSLFSAPDKLIRLHFIPFRVQKQLPSAHSRPSV